MRWFVEVSPAGDSSQNTRYCIEAKQWQAALQETRKQLGDSGPLSKFAIELLDNGYRAVDPVNKTRFVVAKAPDDAELTPACNGNVIAQAKPAQALVLPPIDGDDTAEKPPSAAAASKPAQAAAEAQPQAAAEAQPQAPATTAQPAAQAEASAAAAELPDYQVVRKRAEDPSERTPITYREFAYAVRPDTSPEAATALIISRFREVSSSLATRPPGKFVQLAVFDHVFEERPASKPLVTLAWKDWRGDPVLQYPGGKQAGPASEPPPQSIPPYSGPGIEAVPASLSDPEVADALSGEVEVAVEATEPELLSDASAVSAPDSSAASASAPDASAPDASASAVSAPDSSASAPDASAPHGRGKSKRKGRKSKPGSKRAEHLTTQPDTPSQKLQPKVSKRDGKNDLISDLFETMHNLHFAADVMSGADFTLDVILKSLPCDAALVHIFDINTRRFVVVRVSGSVPKELLLHATPDLDPLFRDVLRAPRSRRVGDFKKQAGDHWSKLGLEPQAALLGPVRQGGRYLGVIELFNPSDGGAFFENEANALDYICEQFAEFLSQRPLVLDADVVLAKPK